MSAIGKGMMAVVAGAIGLLWKRRGPKTKPQPHPGTGGGTVNDPKPHDHEEEAK